MAIRITDSTGVNLLEQPPAQVTVAYIVPYGGRATVKCNVITEDGIPDQYSNGTLFWDDGSLPVVYSGNYSGTLAIDTYRDLPPGSYVIRLEAHDYATPVWNTVSVNFHVSVRADETLTYSSPSLYGPILPKDVGYPNADQWNWNSGEDTDILVSSVKMLLTTRKGERIMQPDYGTNLSSILFELNVKGIENLVQQEIASALSKWEPRVGIQFLNVEKTADREITVYATFVSRLNQRNFAIPLVFNT